MESALKLGDGQTAIASYQAVDGAHGVIFCDNKGGTVGIDTEHGERPVEDVEGMFLIITSSCKESIQVLIDKLEEAKRFFE
jgi:hypothetical protein